MVEMMIAIFIFSVITTALFSIIPSLYKIDRYALQQTSAVDEARRGMKTMLRELREAGSGENGAYMIELAMPNELIFYSDIDQDNKIERIRYFLGEISTNEIEQDIVNYDDGGNGVVVFSDFLQGDLNGAQLQIGVEGDLGSSNENIGLVIDGNSVNSFCTQSSSCSDCTGYFQDIKIIDVTEYAQDDYMEIWLNSSSRVNDFCDWQHTNHSFIGNLTLSIDQEVAGFDQEFQKGVIEPSDDIIPEYILDNEAISAISHYIQNRVDSPTKSVFYYYDRNGDEVLNTQDNLEQISLIKLKLIVNVDSGTKPNDYYLESKVKLRSLSLDDEE